MTDEELARLKASAESMSAKEADAGGHGDYVCSLPPDTVLALIAEVERLKESIARHEEICTIERSDEPNEVDRLNPYKRQWRKQEVPDGPLPNFLHGIRYYAGMLEDDDNWPHGLGHIESLCRDFQKAIDSRSRGDQ